ncbi:hypothetical protein K2173_022515 [Erythroxylum novogranatense]|uniref:DYW domain-containing protein n=1 Tax=Erythroxylum novogranatense TaxID=1862640 RepID=A0AAV8TJ57_9ROSI|nr:hypothetical protein K2173_022515 [Erythroxylum novogranatense]
MALYTMAHFIYKLQNLSLFTSATSAHAHLFKSGLLASTLTVNHLNNCYVRLRRIDYARQLFEEMAEPNVVSWSSLMAGYIDTGSPEFALWLYARMRESSVMPNEFTLATVSNACSLLAELKTGKKLHAQVAILGFQRNLVVCSSLVDMYGKCNDVDGARRVFDLMGHRNVVTWTSMIAVYAQNARGHEALQVFREFNRLMMEPPNSFTLACVINVCASLGRLVPGKVTHAVVIRIGCESNGVVSSALVDMYSKCGCFSYSDKVFRRIHDPSVIPYTSMIVSAAKYGLGELSLKLFEQMIRRAIKPNDITFVGVLHACSHSGLVDEGLKYLNSMQTKHGITPSAKHYTCVVDMLGRTGRLNEAYQLAKSVKVDGSEVAPMWAALLSASRLQGRVDIAIESGNRIIDSNEQVACAYVTLSNTFALAGEWNNVHGLRAKMKNAGVYKDPGCSWIEVKDSIYQFRAGDLSCERGTEILSFLQELQRKMRERGYVGGGGGTGLVFVEVEEESVEQIVGLHSEKLALAFGLISIPKGITIRIMKNLRMCSDCHEAFKLISQIEDAEFLVRDINRFHHFKNGYCTCRDFW